MLTHFIDPKLPAYSQLVRYTGSGAYNAVANNASFSSANAVWTVAGCDKQVLKELQTMFGADHFCLAPPATINKWVATKTKNRITHLVDQISPQTIAVLVNAITFDGQWQEQFQQRLTNEQGVFYKRSGQVVLCPMMHQEEMRGRFIAFRDVTVAMLPYLDREYEAVFIVPNRQHRSDCLDAFLQTMTGEQWVSLMNRLQRSFAHIDVMMPRFELKSGTVDLKSALASLGITDVFNSQYNSLQRAFPGRLQTYVSAIAQSTTLKVNEQGTQAASATMVMCNDLCAPAERPPQLHLDQPFLMAVWHTRTQRIVVAAVVEHPQGSAVPMQVLLTQAPVQIESFWPF